MVLLAKSIYKNHLAAEHTANGALQHRVFFYNKVLNGFQRFLRLLVGEAGFGFQALCQFIHLVLGVAFIHAKHIKHRWEFRNDEIIIRSLGQWLLVNMGF